MRYDVVINTDKTSTHYFEIEDSVLKIAMKIYDMLNFSIKVSQLQHSYVEFVRIQMRKTLAKSIL